MLGANEPMDDFDCVDIYKQPAFQHPMLKHHTIQENFISNEIHKRKDNYKMNDQSCPKGMVPILKQRDGTDNVHLDTIEYPGQHFATIETILDGTIYRGAEAYISIHDLTIQNNQYSKNQIWLENGPRHQLNSIQVGWAVHPRLYGDSLTRFTIFWTADGYRKTGCYNTKCPGFVLVTRYNWLGMYFGRYSINSGKESVYVQPKNFQDRFTGNWIVEVYDELIGYWPKELFTHLNNGASLLRFGGNTFPFPNGISPPMGNGHFPVVDIQKSSNFMFVKAKDSNYQTVEIEDEKIRRYVDAYQCYRLYYGGYSKSTGVVFTYGGPGGNCGI
ncbi:PREDICTED: uncharacterized protein LOC104785634 [Camelina sativa]|uniref:Uncharacterized protein LOC104785634 n=1 Tax=Camelina sativa TaxID=90675 RepID=A0ABM1RP11_CAMSA|nr:PREDICTED: uncharacterized protein LOC104785634 [Camelina sativa]